MHYDWRYAFCGSAPHQSGCRRARPYQFDLAAATTPNWKFMGSDDCCTGTSYMQHS